jgi:hypothetical protein
MSQRPPDFDELVGAELPDDDRERLLRVHELLLQSDPPPALSGPDLEPAVAKAAPSPRAEAGRVRRLHPRRRRVLALGLAAALLVAAFGLGALVGNRTGGPSSTFTVSMHGTPAAAEASASLAVYTLDAGGNWPMQVRVTGLAPAANGNPYELWLTKNGKLAELCGSFRTGTDGSATVPMNAPYRFKDYDGWIVVEHGSQTPLLTT